MFDFSRSIVIVNRYRPSVNSRVDRIDYLLVFKWRKEEPSRVSFEVGKTDASLKYYRTSTDITEKRSVKQAIKALKKQGFVLDKTNLMKNIKYARTALTTRMKELTLREQVFALME